jgi:hypothetical protein
MPHNDPPAFRFRPAFWNDRGTICEPTISYKQESQKEATFRRAEERRNNALRRAVIVYVLIVLSIVLAYTGYLIHDPAVAAETKRWCFGVWGFIIGGMVGYLSPRPI